MRILSLFWHSVESDSINAKYLDGSNPTQSIFREQIEYIVDNYTPISIYDFINISEDNSVLKSYTKPPVLLGFDDGFKNVIDYALPILKEFHVPALFFVIGEILINPEYVPWYVEIEHMLRKSKKKAIYYNNEMYDLSTQKDRNSLKYYLIISYQKLMSDKDRQVFMTELSQLTDIERPRGSLLDRDLCFVNKDDLSNLCANSILTISSHAMTHRLLANLSYDEQLYELKQSDLLLSQNCSFYYPVVSYPNGSFNNHSIAIAKNIYTFAFAILRGSSFRNKYAYPRIGINNEYIRDMEYTLSSLRRNLLLPIKKWIGFFR